MFFQLVLNKVIYIDSSHLGPTLYRDVEIILRKTVEGERIPSIGLVLAVLDIVELPESMNCLVLDEGKVSCCVVYKALVMKLFKGEVALATVTSVENNGFFASIGAANIYVSRTQIPKDYSFYSEDSGPTGIFVHPDGVRYIKEDHVVRVRIICETPQVRKTDAIASITGSFLGPVI